MLYFAQAIYGETFHDYYVTADNESEVVGIVRAMFAKDYGLTKGQQGFVRVAM